MTTNMKKPEHSLKVKQLVELTFSTAYLALSLVLNSETLYPDFYPCRVAAHLSSF